MPIIYDLKNVPDIDTYVAGLTKICPRMSPEHFRIFRTQYYSFAHTANASEIANDAEIKGGHAAVNRLYGGLGHMFCNATGFTPELQPYDKARWWAVWSSGIRKDKRFQWIMRDNVAEALCRLGWIESSMILDEEYRSIQETNIRKSLSDAKSESLARLDSSPRQAVKVNVLRKDFLRNPDVVAVVLDNAEGCCDLCSNQAPFRRASDGSPYLEVHHIISLSEGGQDSIRNAVALCPNCHREMHFGTNKNMHDIHLRQIAETRAIILMKSVGNH